MIFYSKGFQSPLPRKAFCKIVLKIQEVQCIHQCYITKTPTTTKRFSSLKFRKRKKTNESSDSENLITFDLTDLK